MADRRKLQGEIDRCLKKVTEGVEAFEDIWEKVHAATNANQKEKYENDLKKEIKKLQRLRDQIKTWVASNEIKDKKMLLDNRKLIETQMERFKVVERETKTKAYSKEGLGAAQKMDPAQKEKEDLENWLSKVIDDLQQHVEQLEGEVEAIHAGSRKKKIDKDKQERLCEVEIFLEGHRFHIEQLEKVFRLLDNNSVEVDKVKKIKDDVDYYIESYADPDFHDDQELYDELNLDELNQLLANTDALAAAGDKDDSSHDSNISPSLLMYSKEKDESEKRRHKSSDEHSFGSSPIKPSPLRSGSLTAATGKPLDTSPITSSTSFTSHHLGLGSVVSELQSHGLGQPTLDASSISHLPTTHSPTVVSTPLVLPSTLSANATLLNRPDMSSNFNKMMMSNMSGLAGLLQPFVSAAAAAGIPSHTTGAGSGMVGMSNMASAMKPHTHPVSPVVTVSGKSNTLSSTLESLSLTNGSDGGLNKSIGEASLQGKGDEMSSLTFHHPSSSSTSPAEPLTPRSTGIGSIGPLTPSTPTSATSAMSPTASTYMTPSSTSTPVGLGNSRAGLTSPSATAKRLFETSTSITPLLSNVTSNGLNTSSTSSSTAEQQAQSLRNATALLQQINFPAAAAAAAAALGNTNLVSSGTSGITNTSLTSSSAAAVAALTKSLSSSSQAAGVMPTLQSLTSIATGSGGIIISSASNPSHGLVAPPSGPSETHIPPFLGINPVGAAPTLPEHKKALHMLELVQRNMPHPSDSEKLRQYLPRHPCTTPSHYPQTNMPQIDTLDFYTRLNVETLFFIFYYLEGTKAQYMAAKALKKQSWRFHTKYMMWFQRHEEPKTITDEYEQGTYVYFDYEKWCQRKKEGFTFEYKFLEDKDLG